MMTRPLPWVIAAALLLVSQTALAKPKVALTQIEGDTTGDVSDAVAEALEGGELSLIGRKEVNRAVDKLGDVADLTEKDFKKLANELEADAVVLGKLEKVGGTRTLKFRLYVHKKMAKGFTVSFKDPKSEKFRALLHDKMVDKLGAVAGGDERPRRKAADDDEEEARPRKKAAEDDEERPRKKAAEDDKSDHEDRPRKKAADDDDEESLAKKERKGKARHRDDEGASEDEDAPRRSRKKVAASDDGDEIEGGISARVDGPRPANRIAVRADLGVSMVQRSFAFNANEFPQKPKNLTLSPVPGARFEAEAYPLEISSPKSPVAGLGLAVEYDRTFSLSLTSANDMGSFNAPVKQMHYSIGVRYRLPLGKADTSPTLTFGVGYGKRLFSVDLKGVTDDQASKELQRDAPSTEYTIYDPGVSLRFPVTRTVAFVLGGRGMIIPRTGPIQNGTSYGRAKVYGAQGLAALDVVLGTRFALRFSGDFVQIGYTFDGVGALSNGLDGDPSKPDVGGLADRSIGAAATLAVLY
jgi:hypothetical protein